MNPLLLDTHAVVWYLRDPARLSSKALEQIHRSSREGIPLFVSVISLVELVYLVEKERLPQAALEELWVRPIGIWIVSSRRSGSRPALDSLFQGNDGLWNVEWISWLLASYNRF